MLPKPEEFLREWPEERPGRGEELRRLLGSAPPADRPHARWAELCEECGETGLALREYQLALRENPEDVRVLERLAVLYRERGEVERALPLAERRAQLLPHEGSAVRDLVLLYLDAEMPAQAVAAIEEARRRGIDRELADNLLGLVKNAAREEPAEEAATSFVPSEADIARFVHLFSGRENIYARQWCNPDGDHGYTPVHQPFAFQVAKNHLLGNMTVGIYPVRLDGSVTFFAFDVDVNKTAIARARSEPREASRLRAVLREETRKLAEGLIQRGLSPLVEDSGYKGRHLWVFLEEPMEAALVRRFGSLFLGAHPWTCHDLHVEFFPKQDATGTGPGNLIKLPLGVHRRTGRRSRLLEPDGTPIEKPFLVLRNVSRVPRRRIEQTILDLKSVALPAPGAGTVPEDRAVTPNPSPPPPAWTAADFETHPEISAILSHCPVLAALKKRAEDCRRLTHDEQVVLVHSLGHSSAGVLAVNHLFGLCLDVPPAVRLQAPLAGHPISCPKIRKRIPHITSQVNCNCSFEFAPERYPTPRLHLLRPLPAARSQQEESTLDPRESARALHRLWSQRAELQERIERLEKELVAWLTQQPEGRLATEEGTLVLVTPPGAAASLAWEAVRPGEEEAKAESS